MPRSEEVPKTIVELAKSEAIDLLVMGTVCRTGIAGFIIGNTAEKVLSVVNCSVLTVKPEGFVTPVTLEET
jgi:nucleotide-binding universal stress UspA family protein